MLAQALMTKLRSTSSRLSLVEMELMLPYWFEWWCRLFGYGSCRSIPTLDAFVFWGGTTLAAIAILFVIINRVIDRL